jgi:hypothetical protein
MTAKTASLARDKRTNRALDDVNEPACGMTEDAREQLHAGSASLNAGVYPERQ